MFGFLCSLCLDPGLDFLLVGWLLPEVWLGFVISGLGVVIFVGFTVVCWWVPGFPGLSGVSWVLGRFLDFWVFPGLSGALCMCAL